VIAYADDLMI